MLFGRKDGPSVLLVEGSVGRCGSSPTRAGTRQKEPRFVRSDGAVWGNAVEDAGAEALLRQAGVQTLDVPPARARPGERSRGGVRSEPGAGGWPLYSAGAGQWPALAVEGGNSRSCSMAAKR
ncbi:hypothetical protein GCM10010508_63210 [Streptomyces naganishii JCM 4654]|uniref:Uncharacterized protein n=1 Tax=Streptomyces naganishii JCM 4654 TaxID=1306179 RepID=A0A918YAU4_9ACTN|nr:hypothetical protein GCM10010508_63210 [Streptomyces naganishii JCM 4654]